MPYLTPEEIPEATDCRSLLIPASSEWLAIVSGAINELSQEWNWQQEGAVTTEEAAQAMLAMWLDFVSSTCGSSCRRIFRVSITGEFEQSDDGGETWTTPSGDAEVPATPAREEPTSDERRCLAAANATNVLAQVYEQMLDAWQLDQSITYGQGVFVAALAGLIGVWLGIISAGAINLALGVFATAYEILDNLTQDAWDADFNDKLKCLLYSVSTDTAGVVTFNYDDFLQGLADMAATNPIEQALLVAQLNYMMLWIGADGLNHAGATTAITEADCGTGSFTISVTFDAGSGTYRLIKGDIVAGGQAGDCAADNAPQTRPAPQVGKEVFCIVDVPLPNAATVTGVTHYMKGQRSDLASGGVITKVQFLDEAGVVIQEQSYFENANLGWRLINFGSYNQSNARVVRFVTSMGTASIGAWTAFAGLDTITITGSGGCA